MFKTTPHGCRNHAAFSLIQLSVVLTVLSLLLSGMLPIANQKATEQRTRVTLARMQAIEASLRGYRAATRTYPCPANASLSLQAASFGNAMTPAGSCGGGMYGSSSNTVAGGLPVKELGLPADYAMDGWGRRFTYAVDQRTTHVVDPIAPSSLVNISCTAGSKNVRITTPFLHGLSVGDSLNIVGWPVLALITCPSLNILGARTVTQVVSTTSFVFQQASPAILGLSITIGGVDLRKSAGQDCSDIGTNLAVRVRKQDGTEQKSALVIVSHGADGHGAFPASGSTLTGRMNAHSSDADELENASVDGSFATAFNALFVSRSPTGTFDDIVHYTTTCAQ